MSFVLLLYAAGPAVGAPSVRLNAAFQPDRPGQSTTIRWSFTLSEPQSLRSMQLHLPAGIGFVTSSLGLEPCEPARLEQAGAAGCPADSRVGHGSALVQLPAETAVPESATVTALMGPRPPEGMTILFSIEGRWPIERGIVLTSQLLHLASAGGATLLAETAPVSLWPAGPALELSSFSATLGPQGLTYYRRVHGHTVAFVPRGLTLPRHCPRSGFPISATFSWWTAPATTVAHTRVPCPKRG